MSNFYQILGIGQEATVDDIKRAYKYKLLNTHPDKVKTMVVNDEIPLIKLAYLTLVNPNNKLKYDQQLIETSKLNGYNINGGGLDVYSLDDFEYKKSWYKDCPRCDAKHSIELTEDDLENGTSDCQGGYDIIVQCNSCSLWIQVKYYEELSESDPETDSSESESLPNNQLLKENLLAGASLKDEAK